jgi:hypothetical protein
LRRSLADSEQSASFAARKVSSRNEYQKRSFLGQVQDVPKVAHFGAFLCVKTRAFIYDPKAKGFDEF